MLSGRKERRRYGVRGGMTTAVKEKHDVLLLLLGLGVNLKKQASHSTRAICRLADGAPGMSSSTEARGLESSRSGWAKVATVEKSESFV